MRDDFGCAPLLCSSSGGWGADVPFWAILILVILGSLLIASLLQPAKPPPTLQKAVDEVLENYQKQAVVWDDRKAETAFREARDKVRDVIAKYRSTPI